MGTLCFKNFARLLRGACQDMSNDEFAGKLFKCLVDDMPSHTSEILNGERNVPKYIVKRSQENRIREAAKEGFIGEFTNVLRRSKTKLLVDQLTDLINNDTSINESEKKRLLAHVTDDTYQFFVDTFIYALPIKDSTEDIELKTNENSNAEYSVQKDFKSTLEKAKSGDIEAMYEIGFMYYHGFVNDDESQSKVNYREAFKWLKLVSDKEDGEISVSANAIIAKMYYSGVVPREEQSFNKSIDYRKKDGGETSLVNLQNILFMKLEGIEKGYDFDETQKWIEQLSESGQSSSVINRFIAEFYLKYAYYEKALIYYEKIDDENPEVEYQIGEIYLRGLYQQPPKPDPYTAERHFLRAAKYGHQESLFKLGIINFRGAYGYRQNLQDARKYYYEAAIKGHTLAAYNYAWMCKYGLGGNRSIPDAIDFFLIASDGGNILSNAELGILYQEPECRDYRRAFAFQKKAADAGDAYSQFGLANLYLFGRGCFADIDKAALYYQLAYEGGIDEAKYMLKRIHLIDKESHS